MRLKNLMTMLLIWGLVIQAKSQSSNELFYPVGTDFDYVSATNSSLLTNSSKLPDVYIRLFAEQRIRDAKANALLNDQTREAAVKAGESYPEAQDPTGNWGAVVGGFRLSLRSATNSYKLGDPIPVNVIIRNVTTNTLSVMDLSKDIKTRFVFEEEAGKTIVRDCELGKIAAGSGYGFIQVPPKRQIKYEYDLKNWHNFKPGIYKIHAEQIVLDTRYTNINSGVLVLKLNPKPQP